MAVIGVARVNNIQVGSTDPTKVDVQLVYVGIKSGNPVSAAFFTINDLDPAILNALWEGALKQATRDQLINVHGYTFGLLDSVRLVGETLI